MGKVIVAHQHRVGVAQGFAQDTCRCPRSDAADGQEAAAEHVATLRGRGLESCGLGCEPSQDLGARALYTAEMQLGVALRRESGSGGKEPKLRPGPRGPLDVAGAEQGEGAPRGNRLHAVSEHGCDGCLEDPIGAPDTEGTGLPGPANNVVVGDELLGAVS